ncbi:ankyrin repeat domain-containing protein 31 isoform X2 [Anolis carolinensis]|nr:PREDICTED: putative ankyrin repeat domain-containing protein 31 isoform X2 [Anolis carolinensis]|eukprot:XP_016846394.1 PREDICTED: putative ankyrin repeat domain-containing protein 31 isoform X2 [Anolis carolinensis]
MADGGDASDSDETIIEGSVLESDLDEEELRGKRLFLIGKDIALAAENDITKGVRNINEGELSPEIQFIFKPGDNLPILKEKDPVNLLSPESDEKEDSPSLLQSGINCPVFAAGIRQADCPQVATPDGEYQNSLGLGLEVGALVELSDRNRLNNENSPERSLLSVMDIVEDSITKCTEPKKVFQSSEITSEGKDMTDKGPSLTCGITANIIVAKNFEKILMEPLTDSETQQMVELLGYQDDALSMDPSGNEESSDLPAELFRALNCLSESVAQYAIFHPLEKDTTIEKYLDQTDDDCTQITETNLKYQLNSQHFEETEAEMVTKMVCTSKEQNINSHDRPAEKENSTSKDTSSCEQPDQVSSFRNSNTKDKTQKCSQLGNGSLLHSPSNSNFKVKPVRKSQRIAKKQRQYNYISLLARKNTSGQTILHRAAMEDDLDCILTMIHNGADVDVQDDAGWTALHKTSVAGFFEATNELLKAGAEVNCKGKDQVTPLHEAVKGGHYKVAELLLWYGADPLTKNEKGKSALEESTDRHMTKLLERYSAKFRKNSAAGERELHSSRSKKTRCCDGYENDNLVLQPTSASLKCGKNESINKVLQEVNENQERLLLFELKNQKDADLYIQHLTQIQNTLNDILAKQKSERDKLVNKYRASAESFKQGALREQLIKLVSRQKRLLLMAQKQKELGGKIQNYKTSRKEFSSSSKNVLGYCESSNTKHDTCHKTVPCLDVVKISSVMEHNYSSRSPNFPVGNGQVIGQKEVDQQNLAGEYSKSFHAVDQAILPSASCIQHLIETDSLSVTPQRNKPLTVTSRIYISNDSETGSSGIINSNQPVTESQQVFTNELLQPHSDINDSFQMQPEPMYCYLSTPKNTIPKNRISFTANLEPAEIFSKSMITQTASDSASQLSFRRSKSKTHPLANLFQRGKIKPGEDVLEFMLEDSKHKASLLEKGKVKGGNNSIYQNPRQWVKALLGNDIAVTWKYVSNKVKYCGNLLSDIMAEVHVPRGPELLLKQKSLPEQDHNQDTEDNSFSHNNGFLQDMENTQQEIASFSQEGEIPQSCEIESEEIPSSMFKKKLSPQSISLKTSRFLQFNNIVLIQDEEFMPCHTMDQYWNFYVHCENFGF